MRAHRTEEAIEICHDLLKQEPNDAEAHSCLGRALLSAKRNSEGIAELETAVALDPKNWDLEELLAEGYLGIGRSENALATFKKVVELDPTPDTWAFVAYALSDANASYLPEAQHYAEMAVNARESEAAKISLNNLQSADLDCMLTLSAHWDILGWVYFLRGNLEEAERYLDASWNLEQDEGTGDHLAQVYEKLGESRTAIHTYALALAASRVPPKDTQSRLAHLLPDEAKAKAEIEIARGELSEMRRVKLGKLPIKSGSAEFFVLFSPGSKIEDVKFISGPEELRPLAKAISSAKYHAPLPDDAPTKLVRRGVLICEGMGLGCDFTLFPVDSVHAIN